jgi:hypothetical protein
MESLWNILKSTLIEKNTDGTVNVMGSMKRLGALLVILTVVSICMTCLQPSFTIDIFKFHLSFDHTQYKIGDYENTIKYLLGAFALYVGIGETAATLQNLHNVKYTGNSDGDAKTDATKTP